MIRHRRSFRASHGIATPITQRVLVLTLGVGVLAACGAADPSHGSATTPVSSESGGKDDSAGAVIASRDARGAATFLWGAKGGAAQSMSGPLRDVARAHLVRNASLLGISEAIARGAILSNEHRLPGGGSVHAFTQRIDGIEVYRTRASVVMNGANELVAITGNLRSARPAKGGRFTMTPEQALARAYADRFGVPLAAGAIVDAGPEANGEYRAYRVSTPALAPRLVDTARVRKVYVPEKGRLVAAYHAEFVARAPGSKDNDGWLYAIAADDGRTLVRSSITAHEKFTYRVWADANNVPTDGPLADTTPLPSTATPGIKEAPAIAPVLVTLEGFNKNPAGIADPWLSASATETKGNNVDAYSDRNSADDGTGDGFDPGIDFRADVTAPRTFDRTYDLTKQPNVSTNQIKAAVTQIFYVTNWLHDYWYDSGFDEASGNGQQSNYGRGGKEGDPLLAEGQDGADVDQNNNANMSSYSDGRSPRMQMYVWSGLPNSSLAAVPPVVFDDQTGEAVFGPQTFDTSGSAVLADVADACTVPTNVTGKIAVIDRGTCDFTVKATNCQTGGAIGVVLIDNAPGHVAPSPGAAGTGITIPLLGLSLEDGAKLKTQLGAGPVSLTLVRGVEILRDGTIDNDVVAHEWGHYLHHRLVVCGNPSCGGMSEGFADFDALMLVIKEGDNLDGTMFPLTQYASINSYFGTRRAPYSSDTTKNPFTFKHIRKSAELPTGAPLLPVSPDMNEDHNVGEVWAETLFEAYTNLLRDAQGPSARFTFAQAKRRMADYIVAGMKATPPEPTFVEQRDAILAVAYARDMKDFTALAKGFAKRGLGVGAVAPPITSTSLDEAVEDRSFVGNLAYLDGTIDDAVRSCDRDGFLDADEKGDVTIRVRNAGWVSLKNTDVTVTTTTSGVSLANGGKGTIVSVDPLGVVKVRIGIAFDPAAIKQTTVPITVTLANPDSFATSVTGNLEPRANFDVAPNTAKTDDVESPTSAWVLAHGAVDPKNVWSRKVLEGGAGKPVSPPDFHWHGEDLGMQSDESLVSPNLAVSATERFTISFKHRYSFELGPDAPDAPDSYFDGGVLEFSTDGGATWADVATVVDPGYTQTLYLPPVATPGDDNPLHGRRAFAGVQANWSPVTVDLGTALAGKNVTIRFRIGTDGGNGDLGWDIDALAFTGITNQPFPTLIDDTSVCKGVPIPKAGNPQTVLPGAMVTLDASGSSDPDKDPITFVWEQLDGEDVKLATPETVTTTFTAPKVTEDTKLLFRVTVADAKQAASDTVEIVVSPTLSTSGSGEDLGSPGAPAPASDNCACTQVGASKNAGAASPFALLAGAIALVFRARRSRTRQSARQSR